MRKMGFIGLGNMGLPMALNVVAKSGRELVVYDLRAEAVAQAVAAGAQAAADVPALARACDVVYVSLPTPALVEQVLMGPQGLMEAAQPGLRVVDLSTNSPAVAQRVAGRLAAAGVVYLESPVTGGVRKASEGTLAIMVGAAPESFAASEALYAAIAEQVFHVGPVGAASTVKLINNMMFLCNLAAAAEGVALAAKAGLDLQKFAEVVRNGSGFSAGFRLTSTRPFANDFSPAFALDLAHKDFALAVELEAELGVPSLMAGPALGLLRMARSQGYGALDCSAVLKVFEGFTGVPARVAVAA